MSEIKCVLCGQLSTISDEQQLMMHKTEQLFGVVEQIFNFLHLAVKEQQPYMTRLCLVTPDIGERKIHLWAGFGETPLERLKVKNDKIAELESELSSLRARLERYEKAMKVLEDEAFRVADGYDFPYLKRAVEEARRALEISEEK